MIENTTPKLQRCRSLPWGALSSIFCRGSYLALLVVLDMSTGLAWARGPVLNPAQLGTFCPPGSELADAKHSQILSIKEQAQIKKTVQGFMALDADARRGGNPLGTAEYWNKGYTLRFEDKAAPVDWLQYIALRFSNLCVQEDSVLYVPLLDIAVFGPGEVPTVWKDSQLSTQKYWDAFERVLVRPPSATATAIPVQPLIFTALPLFKDSTGHWVVDQGKVPNLIKFRRNEWQRQIDQTNQFSCSQPKSGPQYSAARCAQMEQDKATLKQLTRPAWSVVPKDFNPAASPR